MVTLNKAPLKPSIPPPPVPFAPENDNRRAYLVAKRVFDVLLAAVSMVVFCPVFFVIALGVAIQDGFPIFFYQTRVGKDGKPFTIIKFRTMCRDAEARLDREPALRAEYERTFKIHHDPRVSKFGHFLRTRTLDELPQFINILRGDMSFVGPRPVVEAELDKYGDSKQIYLAMKPGCAGLWQCSGRSGTSYEERISMDREYYMRSSIRYDLSILWRTFLAILLRRGAE